MAKVFCTFVIIHPGLFSSPNKVSSLSWTRRRGSDKLAPLIITNLNLSKFWLTCYHLPGIGVLFEINIFSHGHLHESKVWNLCFVNSFLAFPVFTLLVLSTRRCLRFSSCQNNQNMSFFCSFYWLYHTTTIWFRIGQCSLKSCNTLGYLNCIY